MISSWEDGQVTGSFIIYDLIIISGSPLGSTHFRENFPPNLLSCHIEGNQLSLALIIINKGKTDGAAVINGFSKIIRPRSYQSCRRYFLGIFIQGFQNKYPITATAVSNLIKSVIPFDLVAFDDGTEISQIGSEYILYLIVLGHSANR